MPMGVARDALSAEFPCRLPGLAPSWPIGHPAILSSLTPRCLLQVLTGNQSTCRQLLAVPGVEQPLERLHSAASLCQ